MPSSDQVVITPGTTAWLFVSDSADDRHLYDIIFALDVLRKRNFADSDIFVYTDHFAATNHFTPYSFTNIRAIGDFNTHVSSLDYECVVVVVTGHGCQLGIGSGTISPHQLLETIRWISGLKRGVVLLGQCVAGVFNLVDAFSSPSLVLLGATNLNNSLSAMVSVPPVKQLDDSDGLREWGANIFIWSFFRWLLDPTDIDGDGELSLMDAYKHAGAASNQILIKIKSQLYKEARELSDQVGNLEVTLATMPPDQTQVVALRLAASQSQLQKVLDLLYLHQEPWLLHAKLARKTRFLPH